LTRFSLFSQIFGLLISGALIWNVGPVLVVGSEAPLDPVNHRVAAIAALVVMWLLYLVIARVRAAKKNDQMIATLGESDSRDIDEETRVIQERFAEALRSLKDSNQGKGGKRYIYDIPWYIIIGPPGSGKTTALLNAGLTFPLEDKLGTDSIGGVGGTRHCDWWFTDEAVLVDTAGRFTTQDSHSSVDEAGWGSFVSQLKRYRKEQPINGAMVTMSLSDLIQMSEAERSKTAKTIRLRIDELSKGLGITFPIYFMFTKCDLISGFAEFFAHYGEQERAQVWGETFGMNKAGASEFDVLEYGSQFDELVENLSKQLLDRVHEERDRDERVKMIGFPTQFSSLKDVVCSFVAETFAANKFSTDPLLRGVYYTSGTQEGTPMDRLLGRMALDLGIDESSKVTYSGKGKSYFLRRLLKDVIFKESDVAGVDPQTKRKARVKSVLGYGFAVSLVATSIAGWSLSYQDNMASIGRIATLIDQAKNIDSDVGDAAGNLVQITNELSLLQQAGAADLENSFPDIGLSQAESLASSAATVYTTALENRLLPTLASRVEQRLFAALVSQDPGNVYRYLKAYLMYAGLNTKSGAKLETEFLSTINKEDWDNLLSGQEAVLTELTRHEAVLLASDFVGVVANEQIVNQARTLLKSTPLEEQIYQSISQTLLQQHTHDLDFMKLAGSRAAELFVTRDGRTLTELVMPGMFTVAGYQNAMLPLIEAQSREYVSGNWVMGAHNKLTAPVSFAELQSQVVKVYKREYIQRWETLLSSVQIRETTRPDQVRELLETFALINGPLEVLLGSIQKQTNLGLIEEQLMASTGLRPVSSDAVNVHFASLNNLAGSVELQSLVQNVRELSLLVSEMLNNQNETYPALSVIQGRVEGDNRDVFRGLRTKMPFLPEQVKNWVQNVKNVAWSVVFEHGRLELNRAWQKEVYDPYHEMFGLYPLDPNALEEVEFSILAQFFANSGVLEKFVDDRLGIFIDRSPGQWKQRTIDNERSSIPAADLETLRRLFAVGQSLPLLNQGSNWTFTPKSLSAEAIQFVLTLGSFQNQYIPGSTEVMEVIWPYQSEKHQSWYQFTVSDVAVEPISEEAPLTVSGITAELVAEEGPWSMYRLLQLGKIRTIGNGHYEVRFVQGDLESAYNLRIEGDLNAFGLLAQIKLPKAL
jgi:type VI secretion system protein ImpL